MKALRLRDERGAALILAVGVLVFVAAITTALLGLITTSVRARTQLDVIRNRQYAADAAIEASIAFDRGNHDPGVTGCGNPSSGTTFPDYPAVNGVVIHVECQNISRVVPQNLLLERNIVYSACIPPGPCIDNNTIARAQINFEVTTDPTNPPHAYVQSWSVNK